MTASDKPAGTFRCPRKRIGLSEIGGSRSNRPSNPTDIMRNALCDLIRELKISEREREEFLHFVREDAPAHLLDDISNKIGSTFRIVKRLYWEAKLKEYMETNPPKYDPQKNEYENAPRFLREVWGDFIKNDVLYSDRLTRYDDKIIPAVRRYWHLHGSSSDDVSIPPLSPRPQRRGDLLEQVAANSAYSTEEVIRAAMAEMRARQRQQGHHPSNG